MPTPGDGSLAGQRAIVVGGASGIGFGSARLLGLDGASVTVAGRTESKLAEAAERLASEGIDVSYAVCDALDGPSVKAAVDHASDPEGRLDIAVTVPGAGGVKPLLLIDDDAFAAEVAGNVMPQFLTLKYAGQAMVRNGSGSFVAISSTAAAFSARFLSSYCAGKAAVDHLVTVAADELGEYGIRVNSVRPGLTETPATQATFDRPAWLEQFVSRQAIQRGGQVSDVAAAVRYLAGPESSWVTGQHLAVDGGHTLRAFVDYREMFPLPDVRSALAASAPEADQ